MYWREWASKVYSRRGRMVTTEQLNVIMKGYDPGYASVYMFDEAAASEIKESGSSKGLDKYEVAATHLVMDIDQGDEGLKKAEKVLKSEGLGYQVYSSGGKGYHVYVPHGEIKSHSLPHSHKTQVENWGLIEVADPTLYQHGRLISLPGRVHPKTKNKKQLIYEINGEGLNLSIVRQPPKKIEFKDLLVTEDDLAVVGLKRLTELLTMPPKPGMRHTKLWGTAKDLAESGFPFDVVLGMLLRINALWPDPKEDSEILLAVEQAFRR